MTIFVPSETRLIGNKSGKQFGKSTMNFDKIQFYSSLWEMLLELLELKVIFINEIYEDEYCSLNVINFG